jgi:hypothetical protein
VISNEKKAFVEIMGSPESTMEVSPLDDSDNPARAGLRKAWQKARIIMPSTGCQSKSGHDEKGI